MSDMNRVEKSWLSYREKVVPDASAVQLQECRRAFYAGCQAFYAELLWMLDDNHEPTAEDLRKMNAIVAELNRFSGSVKAGLA